MNTETDCPLPDVPPEKVAEIQRHLNLACLRWHCAVLEQTQKSLDELQEKVFPTGAEVLVSCDDYNGLGVIDLGGIVNGLIQVRRPDAWVRYYHVNNVVPIPAKEVKP